MEQTAAGLRGHTAMIDSMVVSLGSGSLEAVPEGVWDSLRGSQKKGEREAGRGCREGS